MGLRLPRRRSGAVHGRARAVAHGRAQGVRGFAPTPFVCEEAAWPSRRCGTSTSRGSGCSSAWTSTSRWKMAASPTTGAFAPPPRTHAPTGGVAQYPPAVAGFLMGKELLHLGAILDRPTHPFVAILGGKKVEDKIPVIRHLLTRADAILLGGAMSYTFLRAKGLEVGTSLVEPEMVGLAGELMEEARRREVAFELPVDVVVAQSPEGGPTRVVPVELLPPDWMGVDIGPRTREQFIDVVKR